MTKINGRLKRSSRDLDCLKPWNFVKMRLFYQAVLPIADEHVHKNSNFIIEA